METIDLILMLDNYDAAQACSNFGGVFGLLGWAYNIIRIAVPIILVVMGMITMMTAVFSKSEDEISKATKSLVQKFIAAIAVFLVLSIVKFIFTNVVGDTTWAKSSCWNCIVDPQQSKCKIPKWNP